MAKATFVWDDENIAHVAAHGLTPGEIEADLDELGNVGAIVVDGERFEVKGRDDLSETGEGDQVVTQGMTMALAALIFRLKARRESLGLTITEAARRSRLTVVTLSRLENYHNRNPSFDTVFRYAMALDALVTLDFEELEPDDERE